MNLHRLQHSVLPVLLAFGSIASYGQSIPTKEYVRLGGRVIAVESSGILLNPTSDLVASSGTSTARTFAVNAPTGLAWTATADQTWVTITAGASGVGNGNVSWTASSNNGTNRTATISVTATGMAPASFQITQTGGSLLTFTAPTSTLPSTSGTVTLTVGADPPTVPWSIALPSGSWLSVASGSSLTGTGPATVQMNYTAWVSGRQATTATLSSTAQGTTPITLTFAQQSSTPTVQYSSTYTSGTVINSRPVSYPVTVTTGGTTWSVSNPLSWVTVNNPTGTSGGQFTFNVAANYEASQRSGSLTITSSSASTSILIVQNPVQSIMVLPDTPGTYVQVAPGASYQFQVALDGVQDQTVSSLGYINWSKDAIDGSISSTGSFQTPQFQDGYTSRVYATFTPLGITNTNSANILAWSGTLPPSPLSLESNNSTGAGATFAARYKFDGGSSQIGLVRLIFDLAGSGLWDCWVNVQSNNTPAYTYLAAPGQLNVSGYLAQPGNVLTLPQTCSLDAASGSLSSDATTRTVTLPLTFPGAPLGPRELLMQASTPSNSLSSNYIPMGVYTVAEAPTVSLVNPLSGVGIGTTFTGDFTYSGGTSALGTLDLLISGANKNPANACLVRYKRSSNLLYLLQNDGTTEGQGYAPGTAGATLQNSQCTLNVSNASVVAQPSGLTLRLILPVTFKAPFLGARISSLRAATSSGIDSGYVTKGSWTVDEPPTGVSVNPSSGSGISRTFSFTFGDPNGYADLVEMYALIGPSAAAGCAVNYNPGSNALSLIGTAGTITPGSGSLSNGRCTLNGAASSVSAGGNTRTLNAALTFSSSFAGDYTVSLYARDIQGAEDIRPFGTWSTYETAEIPTFSVPAGTYSSIQSVSISSPGATIHYTTDGTNPTSSSAVYSGPLQIATSTVLRAIAVKVGLPNSPIKTATYTIDIPPAWYPGAGTWNFRKLITIDRTKVSGGDLSNFPVLISIDADASIAAAARSDGNDILFTAGNGTVKLDHEIESYTPATGTLRAWVRIPSLSSQANTTVFLYYGNASASSQQNKTGVWDSSFVGVWHMSETGATLADSTAFGNLATKSSPTSPNPTNPAMIVGGQTFGTSGGQTTVAADAEFATTDFTVQTWVKPNNTSTWRRIFQYPSGLGSGPMMVNSYGVLQVRMSGVEYSTPSSALPNGAWSHVVLTRSGSVPLLFVNGQSVTLNQGYQGLSQTSSSIFLGSRPDGNSSLDGTLDEVRISNSRRTAEWILTEYNNQSSPNTFISVGSAQAGAVATPQFSPAEGNYSATQSVTISTNTSGATLYYTTDGSTPTTSSMVYSGPITVSSSSVLKAIGVKAGVTTSAVGSASYVIQAATPIFSPAAGTYPASQSVTITSAGATIYYTTDGSAPTTSSTVYSAPVTVAVNQTLRALAVKPGMLNSPVADSAYAIQSAVPTFSPAGGTYSVAQSVTLSSTTSGATIYYTTNGSTPTTSSAIYSTPLTIATTQTVKAISAKTGMTPSAVSTASYSFGPAWYSTGGIWTHRKQITIDRTKVSGGSALSNFTVMFTESSDAGLAASARSDGFDILFTLGDGTTKLDHEIDRYVSSTGQIAAWIRIPTLAVATDTTVFMYYGNTSAANQQNKPGTWDTNFKGVWHLGDGSTLNTADTITGTTATNYGVTATTAQVVGGASINGGTNRLDYGSSMLSSIDFTDKTVTAWINPTTLTPPSGYSNVGLVDKDFDNSGVYGGWGVWLGSTGKLWWWNHSGKQLVNNDGASVATNTWTQVTVTWNAASKTATFYVNGSPSGTALTDTSISPNASSTQPLLLGAKRSGVANFPGKMDEVRVSNSIRSAGWIATEYNNQSSPGTFYSVGTEQ